MTKKNTQLQCFCKTFCPKVILSFQNRKGKDSKKAETYMKVVEGWRKLQKFHEKGNLNKEFCVVKLPKIGTDN